MSSKKKTIKKGNTMSKERKISDKSENSKKIVNDTTKLDDYFVFDPTKNENVYYFHDKPLYPLLKDEEEKILFAISKYPQKTIFISDLENWALGAGIDHFFEKLWTLYQSNKVYIVKGRLLSDHKTYVVADDPKDQFHKNGGRYTMLWKV